MRPFLSLIVALLICASCAKSTATDQVLPPGSTITPLSQPAYVGIGRYSKLAETTVPQSLGGIPFISFVEVRQSAGSTYPQRDVAGFAYAIKGPHSVSWDDGAKGRTVDEGTAAWMDGEIANVNFTSSETVWYMVALRSIAQRNTPPPYPSFRVLYASPDLTAPPSGKNLIHQLGMITMDPGGRTSAHSHGGTEAFYVMKGTVQLAVNNGTRTNVSAGQGASVRPGLIMQLRVVGDEPVQILTYFVTPEGEPWQTNVQTVP